MNYALAGNLVHVFPILAVKRPRNNEEDGQEKHDFLANLDSRLLVGLCRVSEKIDEVVHSAVELSRGHNARSGHFQ